MKIMIDTLSKNRALFLILLNILLLVGVVLQKDPFHLFEKTYESSEKFYKANLSEISKIIYKRKNEDCHRDSEQSVFHYCSSDSKAPLKPKVAEELIVGLH